MLPSLRFHKVFSNTEHLSAPLGNTSTCFPSFPILTVCLCVLSEGSLDTLSKSRQAVVSEAGWHFHGVSIACSFIPRKGSADVELALPYPGMCRCVLSNELGSHSWKRPADRRRSSVPVLASPFPPAPSPLSSQPSFTEGGTLAPRGEGT